MVSQALESVTRAFYARSDLDLILSSPVAARKVFAVRMPRWRFRPSHGVLLAAPFINVLDSAAARAGSPPTGWSWRSARRRRHRARAHDRVVPHDWPEADAARRAGRGRGDRRGVRHRPADGGDPLLRHAVAILVLGSDWLVASRPTRTASCGGRRARSSAISGRLLPCSLRALLLLAAAIAFFSRVSPIT